MQTSDQYLRDINFELHPKKIESVNAVLKKYVSYLTFMELVKRDICNKKSTVVSGA